MSNDRCFYMVMVTIFALVWVFYAGAHLRVLDRIEYQLSMNTLALDHCSTALSAMVASRVAPIKCTLAETYWQNMPQYTNNFIHSVRFEEVKK